MDTTYETGPSKRLGVRLREMRTLTKQSIEETAFRSGLSLERVKQLERGDGPSPTWEEACALADATRSTLDYFNAERSYEQALAGRREPGPQEKLLLNALAFADQACFPVIQEHHRDDSDTYSCPCQVCRMVDAVQFFLGAALSRFGWYFYRKEWGRLCIPKEKRAEKILAELLPPDPEMNSALAEWSAEDEEADVEEGMELNLEPELQDAVEQAASARGISVEEWIEIAVREHLRENGIWLPDSPRITDDAE